MIEKSNLKLDHFRGLSRIALLCKRHQTLHRLNVFALRFVVENVSGFSVENLRTKVKVKIILHIFILKIITKNVYRPARSWIPTIVTPIGQAALPLNIKRLMTNHHQWITRKYHAKTRWFSLYLNENTTHTHTNGQQNVRVVCFDVFFLLYTHRNAIQMFSNFVVQFTAWQLFEQRFGVLLTLHECSYRNRINDIQCFSFCLAMNKYSPVAIFPCIDFLSASVRWLKSSSHSLINF